MLLFIELKLGGPLIYIKKALEMVLKAFRYCRVLNELYCRDEFLSSMHQKKAFFFASIGNCEERSNQTIDPFHFGAVLHDAQNSDTSRCER